MRISRFLCTIVLVTLSLFSCDGASAEVDAEAMAADMVAMENIRTPKLRKYTIERSKYDAGDITLLMGNAEMGGRAHLSGLGFDQLYFSDLWRNNFSRFPIFGPSFIVGKKNTIENKSTINRRETFERGEVQTYSQKLSLEDGVLTTQMKTTNGSYESEIFFSADNRDLLILRLSGLQGNAKEELFLKLPVFDVKMRDEPKPWRGNFYQES